MLKLNYNDGLTLTHFEGDLATVIAHRVTVCLQAGAPLYVLPGSASILLPSLLPATRQLRSLFAAVPADSEFDELTLEGTWLAPTLDNDGGLFLAAYATASEQALCSLVEQVYGCSAALAD